MALSLTRPDPSSPADVSTASFGSARKGFDPDEVRAFLREVADELSRLQERVAELEGELQALRNAPPVSIAQLDEEVAAGLLSEEATRIVASARESAAQIKTRAEEASAGLLHDANVEAQRVRAEAEIDAGRRRQDAAASAEDELQMAKQQGRDMVNEARAYRERVLGELARRRELARTQIEQLIHNRDRLMQSFEKSRLIAMEVMAEMAPGGSTGELVDLGPITGPVPVIMPVHDVEVPKPKSIREPQIEPVPPELLPVEPVQPEPVQPVVAIRDHAVDDLFARMRAAEEPALPKQSKATPPKKKAAKKAPPKQDSPKQQELSVFQATPAEPHSTAGSVDSPFGCRDAQLAPLIAAGSRNLKRVLADEQNDVLQLLRGRDAIRSLTTVLPNVDSHIRRYADAIADQLLHAALAGAAGVDDGSADEQRAAISRDAALEPAIEALAGAIVTPLRDRVERAIVAADGDNSELVNITRTVYREWKTRRIDEQLDHVVRVAFGRGALAVLPAGTPLCWAVDPNGPICPDAEDNALAGAIGAGDRFPTEHVSAPAHEGCRCMLLLAAR
jgi:DivIVA domain-containing protein